MSFTSATPYIASYVLLKRDNKLAFLLRKNTGWMDGFYGLPAGKVEKDEQFSQAAAREVSEEVGIKLNSKDLRFVHISHRHAEADWVDVIFEATNWQGEPHNAEPDKHSELVWLDTDDFPENIIPAVRFFLEEISHGKLYSEYGWEKK